MKQHLVLKNTYFDSVTLMKTANDLKQELNLPEFVLLMATDMNKDMIKSVDLFDKSFESATPNDLLVALETDKKIDNVETLIINSLSSKKQNKDDSKVVYKTLRQAVNQFEPNITIISTPGVYAAFEAFRALENNLNVMMFSDNVTVEDEIKLKDLAVKKDLLMMGPDCGTAIINGVGLCFANKIKRGPIGLVAASGTGLQEVTVLIDQFGGGISQAIGVGGRDLSKDVMGRMTLHAINALNADEETKIIVIISKPPHKDVVKVLIEKLETVNKEIVLCLLDSKLELNSKHIHTTINLTETAVKAVTLLGFHPTNLLTLSNEDKSFIESERKLYQKDQSKLKALFCGGTLAAEALALIRPYVKEIKSNIAKKEYETLENPLESKGHNIIDLGDDIFTRGKPHPMIEPSIRNERILKEAKLIETKVILLDFELGYGSHEDPVGITLDAIKKSREIAKKDNRHITFVAYVCGTKQDEQGFDRQVKALLDHGVYVAKSNAHAAIIAGELVKEV